MFIIGQLTLNKVLHIITETEVRRTQFVRLCIFAVATRSKKVVLEHD